MTSAKKNIRPEMRTLDRWVGRLLDLPIAIECPSMSILGHDQEPPLFTGPGCIYIRSRTKMEFVMHATPRDGGEAFRRMVRAEKNPYAPQDQFRLCATEYDETEWHCGWTRLQLGESSANIWRLSGPLDSISTNVSGQGVATESSVELVYDTELRIPTPMNMVRSVKLDDDEILWSRGRGRRVVEVASTQIEFSHAAERKMVWATAKTSPLFPHPYAENWISEPLQLLLGQLVFPRLVARNKGDGSAFVWLRPSPSHTADTLTSSLLGEDPYATHDRFWDIYRDILTMVVHAKDASGNRNFEAHPLTRYYQEIAQASTGSHWVLCMTLASAAEGITKLLVPPEHRRSDVKTETIRDLRRHIKQWNGDSVLRERMLGSLAHAKEKGIVQSLRVFCRDGTVTPDQVDAWCAVRNRVMHGHLVSPWVDEETQQQLERLTELVHRLSTAYVRKCVSTVS